MNLLESATVGARVILATALGGMALSASSMPLPLHVRGAKILDNHNRPIVLRGVNAASLEWTSDGEGHILKTVDVAVEDWHANVVRIPLSQDRWFGAGPEQTDRGVAYRALVKQVVDRIAAKNAYVILDLHWSDMNQWGQNIGQHLMPDQNSVTFWKDFAKVYRNSPAVLFDLYNEPHDVAWDVWLKGGQVAERGRNGSKTYRAVGMQTLLDTVRTTGAKNVVVAGGLDWAYDMSGFLKGYALKDPTGNGIVYANHDYPMKGDTIDQWIAKMERATKVIPVIVSEFGSQAPAAGGDPWVKRVLGALSTHDWNWTAWDLHPSAGPTLVANWQYMPTPSFGALVKDALEHGGAVAPDLPLLSPVFGSHMVLQRGKPNTFWGWAMPGTKVKVTIGDSSAQGLAGKDGKWTARLGPPPVGGPYKVVVDGPTRAELNDVMVGDVWLCTGQSNMELGITQVKNGAAEVAAANNPNIRLFMAGRQVGYSPQPTNAGEWKVCTPTTVAQGGWGGFSAVGYFFGKELQQKLNVPIGLMEVAWGGTSAEAWTGEEALRPLQDFDPILAKMDERKGGPVYGTYIELWMAENDPGTQRNWQGLFVPTTDWKTVQVPTGVKDLGMDRSGGVAWFRKTVDLPNPVPTGEAFLHLGDMRMVDHAWVDGRLAGNGSGDWDRWYAIPAGTLHPGRNVVAIRVFTPNDQGGFVSKGQLIEMIVGDKHFSLVGQWEGIASAKLAGSTLPRDMEPNPTVPTVLNDGMIAPIAPLAIRGAIWYQGETNSGRAVQYRKLLPAMIAGWRKQFGQGDFPFYIVSLASFMQRQSEPRDDGWAELREAQALTAQRVRNAGLAITTDVGDTLDVHPKDKQTVGHRLALNALALEYGHKLPYSGPIYRSIKREGKAIRVTYAHTDHGLELRDAQRTGFAIAGIDRKWHWAEAKIERDTILVSSAEVPEPVAVRYDWEPNPPATLYNGAGLPAVPFRTDDWPEATRGNK